MTSLALWPVHARLSQTVVRRDRSKRRSYYSVAAWYGQRILKVLTISILTPREHMDGAVVGLIEYARVTTGITNNDTSIAGEKADTSRYQSRSEAGYGKQN